MFNIYSHEKKLKQEEEDAKKRLKDKKIEESRKSNFRFYISSLFFYIVTN